MMEETTNTKERLLRILIRTRKKRPTKKVQKQKLMVGGEKSNIAADNLNTISYRGHKSLQVRGAIRQIVSDKNKDK